MRNVFVAGLVAFQLVGLCFADEPSKDTKVADKPALEESVNREAGALMEFHTKLKSDANASKAFSDFMQGIDGLAEVTQVFSPEDAIVSNFVVGYRFYGANKISETSAKQTIFELLTTTQFDTACEDKCAADPATKKKACGDQPAKMSEDDAAQWEYECKATLSVGCAMNCAKDTTTFSVSEKIVTVDANGKSADTPATK